MRITVSGGEVSVKICVDKKLFAILWRPKSGGYVIDVTEQLSHGAVGFQQALCPYVSKKLEKVSSPMWYIKKDENIVKEVRMMIKNKNIRKSILQRFLIQESI